MALAPYGIDVQMGWAEEPIWGGRSLSMGNNQVDKGRKQGGPGATEGAVGGMFPWPGGGQKGAQMVSPACLQTQLLSPR